MEFEVKPYRDANTTRSIRFTPELFDTLAQISAEQNVSFNSLVLQCCEFAVANIKPEQRPKRETQSLE